MKTICFSLFLERFLMKRFSKETIGKTHNHRFINIDHSSLKLLPTKSFLHNINTPRFWNVINLENG